MGGAVGARSAAGVNVAPPRIAASKSPRPAADPPVGGGGGGGGGAALVDAVVFFRGGGGGGVFLVDGLGGGGGGGAFFATTSRGDAVSAAVGKGGGVGMDEGDEKRGPSPRPSRGSVFSSFSTVLTPIGLCEDGGDASDSGASASVDSAGLDSSDALSLSSSGRVRGESL